MSRPSIRDTVVSTLVWPLRRLFRMGVGEEMYLQARRTFLTQERGLGLDWRWSNSLRTVYPIRRDFGWQAGQTIHRYYTDMCFLPQYAQDIRGHVLEIGDRRYTVHFGGLKVVHSDVLHAKEGNEDATIYCGSHLCPPDSVGQLRLRDTDIHAAMCL